MNHISREWLKMIYIFEQIKTLRREERFLNYNAPAEHSKVCTIQYDDLHPYKNCADCKLKYIVT